MYYTRHFTIIIGSSYATSADAVDDSLERRETWNKKVDNHTKYQMAENMGCMYIGGVGALTTSSLAPTLASSCSILPVGGCDSQPKSA